MGRDHRLRERIAVRGDARGRDARHRLHLGQRRVRRRPGLRDADVLRTFESLGIGALVLFGAAAGLLIITTSVVAGRAVAAALARGGGHVAGVIVLLGGLFFIPLVLFVLWMLVVGIVTLRGSGAAAAG